MIRSRRVATTDDEAFREIQLNGKQLVFLFMAGTVVSVVIFLCGVLVGRGVREARGLPETTGGSALSAAAVEAGAPPAVPAASGNAPGAPVTAGEQLGYGDRLAGASAPSESIEKTEPPPPVAEEPDDAPPPPRSAAPAAPAESPRAAPAEPATPGEPAGAGFAIQVAALRDRAEADVIVRRLAGKGYPAYVLVPAQGAPAVYRVRVGKFKDRREADTVAARLQKEEQFKPWIVR